MAKTIPGNEQVFMVSKSTNTTYSGSASLKAMSEWYTMDDVSNTVKPYKVFTALLTQSGGNNQLFQYNGELIIGVTYYIDDNSGGGDFTNVGAPNNEGGTFFIATGTKPNSWGTDPATNTLTYNSGAPVATVLENTIGNVWFDYVSVGNYGINSDALFTNNKSQVYIPNSGLLNGDILFIVTSPSNENQTYIITYDSPTAQADNILYQTPIEIRVYN